MRHGNKINNLKRKKAHRKALLRNLTINLIEHKRIFTTLAKAKALRKFAEPLFTKAKKNDTHTRRVVFSYLQNKEAIKELFETVGPKVADRPGGYTRIIKLAPRQGDAAEMAMIELVDFNEFGYTGKVEKAATKKKRTRRSKKSDSAGAENTAEAATMDEKAAEEKPKKKATKKKTTKKDSSDKEAKTTKKKTTKKKASDKEATEKKATKKAAKKSDDDKKDEDK